MPCGLVSSGVPSLLPSDQVDAAQRWRGGGTRENQIRCVYVVYGVCIDGGWWPWERRAEWSLTLGFTVLPD
jgi:hypothetical protein